MAYSAKDNRFGTRQQHGHNKPGSGVKPKKKIPPLEQREEDAFRMSLPLRGEDNRAIIPGFLVKFYFKEEKLIPEGLPKANRETNAVMDKFHAAMVEVPDLAARNRHRAGRVDTGEPVVNGLPHVGPDIIRRAFANNRFYLVGAHYFKHPEKNQFVVVLEYRPFAEGTERLELPDATLEAVRLLSRSVWDQVFVWDNPDGKPVTINFSGFCPNQAVEHRYELTVLDGVLKLFSKKEKE